MSGPNNVIIRTRASNIISSTSSASSIVVMPLAVMPAHAGIQRLGLCGVCS